MAIFNSICAWTTGLQNSWKCTSQLTNQGKPCLTHHWMQALCIILLFHLQCLDRPSSACLLPHGHKMAVALLSITCACQARGRERGKKSLHGMLIFKKYFPKPHPVASVCKSLTRIVLHMPRLMMAGQKGIMDEGWVGQPSGSPIPIKIYL